MYQAPGGHCRHKAGTCSVGEASRGSPPGEWVELWKPEAWPGPESREGSFRPRVAKARAGRLEDRGQSLMELQAGGAAEEGAWLAFFRAESCRHVPTAGPRAESIR